MAWQGPMCGYLSDTPLPSSDVTVLQGAGGVAVKHFATRVTPAAGYTLTPPPLHPQP